MSDWQSTYLGRAALPRDLGGFEIEAFFTFSGSERRAIDDDRRTPALKLALALQIGFLRMTGRLLQALRTVPRTGTGDQSRAFTLIMVAGTIWGLD